jgi:organic radical activating enzyme
LAEAVSSAWPVNDSAACPYVVCTGGEPLLQLDEAAISALHDGGFEIGVETNGTISAPEGIDWLCVSPKGVAEVVQRYGDELKLVYPQLEKEAQPENFAGLSFDNFYLQPLDDDKLDANTRAVLDYCLRYPQWRLSLQTHKIIGID